MILVDNSVFSFAFQLDNGIPILPFYTNKDDEELIHLTYYFKCLVDQEDVRDHNKEAFGLEKLALMDFEEVMGKNSLTEEDNSEDNTQMANK